jgi:3'-phosphoadenosine 5'-phosphosulfate sulfotransferase (PAPS reductase)/FAD synthetase
MKYIANCSFGKDSIAMITERMERGEPIDEIIYCKIMYDDKISAELPEHEEFIHNKAIPELERRYGLRTNIVQSDWTYKSYFYRMKQKGKNIGAIYGFPIIRGNWCNSQLKVDPMKKYQRLQDKCKFLVGIAADESGRIQRALDKGQILPLVDYGITEAMAFDICRKHDLLSPAYRNDTKRLGCWFCHNQRICELRKLRQDYPELWQELLIIDKDSPVTFKPRGQTIAGFDARFEREENTNENIYSKRHI